MRAVLDRDYQETVGRDHVRRLMSILSLQAIYPGPKTSQPSPNHQVYPYLLRNIVAAYPNHIWGTDITYIRLAHGFCYLCAFLDWHSRFVLGWSLSNTMETSLCLNAWESATEYGHPAINNSDQGSQFTSLDFTQAVLQSGAQISMDGRGRCLDNIFTERLWRSVKYEDIYPKQYQTIPEARSGLTDYFQLYNYRRPHQSLNYRTPAEVYFNQPINLNQTKKEPNRLALLTP